MESKSKKIQVEISKLMTMADIGLGVERPLNREKRNWIKGLTKNKTQAYFGGTHKRFRILYITGRLAQGLQLAKANKILRDVDRDSKFRLKVSGLINDWAQSQIDK